MKPSRMYLSIAVFTVTFCLLSIGCSEQNVTTPSDITVDIEHMGMISGKVVEINISNNRVVNGPGVPDVPVYLYKGDERVTDTRTEAGGLYAFDSIPAGAYSIWACWNAVTCPEEAKSVIVVKQQNNTVDDYAICYRKGEVLYGRILRENGTPYVGKVTLWELWHSTGGAVARNKFDSTVTSADGSYAFYVDRSVFLIPESGSLSGQGIFSTSAYFECTNEKDYTFYPE